MKPYELDALLKAVAPVDGFNMEGVIFFSEDATQEQVAAATALYEAHISNVSFVA